MQISRLLKMKCAVFGHHSLVWALKVTFKNYLVFFKERAYRLLYVLKLLLLSVFSLKQMAKYELLPKR